VGKTGCGVHKTRACAPAETDRRSPLRTACRRSIRNPGGPAPFLLEINRPPPGKEKEKPREPKARLTQSRTAREMRERWTSVLIVPKRTRFIPVQLPKLRTHAGSSTLVRGRLSIGAQPGWSAVQSQSKSLPPPRFEASTNSVASGGGEDRKSLLARTRWRVIFMTSTDGGQWNEGHTPGHPTWRRAPSRGHDPWCPPGTAWVGGWPGDGLFAIRQVVVAIDPLGRWKINARLGRGSGRGQKRI